VLGEQTVHERTGSFYLARSPSVCEGDVRDKCALDLAKEGVRVRQQTAYEGSSGLGLSPIVCEGDVHDTYDVDVGSVACSSPHSDASSRVATPPF